MVDVLMITYNHETYIEQAIRSVMMQKTSFSFRLLIGEDASSDKTREIVQRLQQEYGARIQPVFRDQNVRARANILDLIGKGKGKYLAFLEGDDFWVDEHKLETVIKYMEEHPKCMATYHGHRLVDNEGKLLEENQRYYSGADFGVEQVNQFLLPGQTSSLVLRNHRDFVPLIERLVKRFGALYCTPLDRIVPIYALSKGNIHVMEQPFSAYRWVTTAGGSWTARHNNWKLKYRECLEYRQMEAFGKMLGVPVTSKIMELHAFQKRCNYYKQKKSLKRCLTVLSMILVMKHRFYILKNVQLTAAERGTFSE